MFYLIQSNSICLVLFSLTLTVHLRCHSAGAGCHPLAKDMNPVLPRVLEAFFTVLSFEAARHFQHRSSH